MASRSATTRRRICERYGLDTPLYAEAVTVPTALSVFTLPAWHHWLT